MRADRHILRTLCVIALCMFSLSIARAADTKQLASGRHPLMNQHGEPFELAHLRGKPSVVHFGFTNCPVVCPTMLNGVAVYMQKLGKRADQFNFVFVSVDPERDTTEVLRQYIGYFDERIIGVTGSADGIARLAERFGTKYEKRAAEGGGYEMAHVIFAYLLDKAGKKSGTLYMGSESNQRVVMKKLTALID